MIGSAGNLYVTASVGEAYGDGVVFKLSETGAEALLGEREIIIAAVLARWVVSRAAEKAAS